MREVMRVVMRGPKRKRPAEGVLSTGRHHTRIVERDKGFEPSTFSLGISEGGSSDQQVREITPPAKPDSARKVLLRQLDRTQTVPKKTGAGAG